VTVKDPTQVGQVLKAARKFRESDFKSVFVKKDSTPLERKELRKKLQERDRRREELRNSQSPPVGQETTEEKKSTVNTVYIDPRL
jgi:cell division GTPase FtsZ